MNHCNKIASRSRRPRTINCCERPEPP